MPPTSNIIVFQAQANTRNAQQQINALNNALGRMHAGAVQSARGTSAAMDTVSTSIGTAIGITVVNALNTATQLFGNLVGNIISNVAFFEKLTVSVTFYSARVLQAADSTLQLNDAMSAASDEAAGTLLILEQLAVESPFNVQQVSNAYRTAQAFGLSKEAVEGMLPLLIDFAAINNLAPDILNRVSLALAQIQARGKLAAQEINQLANAGFPLRDILSEQLDISKSKLDELLKQGLIPSEDAFKAIIGYLKQFEGQAEIVTRKTLTGLISRLEDIRTIAAKDIFLPLFQTAVPTIERLTNILGGNEIKAALTIIGEAFGEKLVKAILAMEKAIVGLANAWLALPAIVKDTIIVFFVAGAAITAITAAIGLLSLAVSTFITQFTVFAAIGAGLIAAYSAVSNLFQNILAPSIQVVAQNVGAIGKAFLDSFAAIGEGVANAEGWLADFLSTVLDWGSTLIQYFASGVEGAFGLIEPIIMGFGALIGGLMAPSSPPKFLPNLETWGRDTANIYLHAWTDADFGILDDVTGQIGKALGALADIGKISDVEVPGILMDIRPVLSEAISQLRNFGTISTQTFDLVKRSAGPLGDEIGLLLERYAELVPATEAASAAQDNLNAITKKYADILEPLQREADKTKGAEQDIADRRSILALQRTIANEAVGDNTRAEAYAKIASIQAAQRLRHTKGIGDAETSTAQKALEAAKLVQKTAEDALKLQQNRLDVQIDSIKLYGDQLKAIEKLRKEQERAAKEARDALLQPLKDALKVYELQQAELKDLISAEKQRYIIANEGFTEAEKAAAAIELQAIAAKQAIRDFEAEELGFNLEEIRNTVIVFDDLGIKLGKAKTEAFDLSEILKGLNKADPKEVFAAFQVTLEETRVKMANLGNEFDGFLDRLNKSLPSFLQFQTDTGETGPLLDNLKASFAGLFTFLTASKIVAVLGTIFAGFTIPAWIIPALTAFVAAYVGNWFGLRDSLASILGDISGTFAESEASAPDDSFFGRLRAAREEAQAISNQGEAGRLFKETGFFPTNDVTGPTVKTQDILPDFLAGEVKIFIDNLDTLPGKIKDAVTNIITNIGAIDFRGIFTGWMQNIRDGLSWWYNEVVPTIWQTFFDGVTNSINTAREKIQEFMSRFDISELFGGAFLSGEAGGEAVGKFVRNIPAKFIEGLTWVFGTALPALIKGLGPVLLQLFSGLGSILGASFRFVIGTLIPGIIAILGTLISYIAGRFVGFFKGLFSGDETESGLESAMEGFKEVFLGLWENLIKPLGTLLWDLLTAILEPIWEGILTGVAEAFGIDPEILLSGWTLLVDGFQRLWDTFTNWWNSLWSGGDVVDEEVVVQQMNVLGPLLDNLLPDSERLIEMWEGLKEFLADTWSTINDVLQSGIDFANEVWDRYVGSFTKTKDSLVLIYKVLREDPEKLRTLLKVVITQMVDFFLEKYQIFLGYWNDLKEGIREAKDSVVQYVKDLVDNFMTKINEWKTFVTVTIPEALANFKETFVTWFEEMKTYIPEKAYELGSSIVQGIKDGIAGLVNAPKAALDFVLQDLLGFGKEAIEAGSPSKLFAREMGVPIGEGILAGIGETRADKEMDDFNESIIDTLYSTEGDLVRATDDLGASMNASLGVFARTAHDNFQKLTASLFVLWEDAMNAILDLIIDTMKEIEEVWNTTWSGMQTQVATTMTGAANSVSLFASSAAKSMSDMKEAVVGSFTGMVDAVDAEVTRLNTALVTRISGTSPDSIISQALLAITGTTTGLQTTAGIGYVLGKSIIDGIIYGIDQNFGRLAETINKRLDEANAVINTSQESSSPSQKWAREVGAPIGQGIAAGILAQGNLIGASATTAVNAGLAYAIGSRPSQISTLNSNISNSNTYQLNVNSQNSQGVIQDFSILKSLVG